MTEVMHTPPALRWVALFLAACAVLGLFLGFRDQIRKNPPGWYTGAEQVATPLPATADGAREAVAFDPNAPQTTTAAPTTAAPVKTGKPAEDEADAEAPATSETPPPPVLTPTTQPVQPTLAPAKPKPATPPPAAAKPTTRPAPQADPVGDILEGQKQPEAPVVPY